MLRLRPRTRNLLALAAVATVLAGLGAARPLAAVLSPPAPLAVTPALVEQGRAVFARRCAGCHRDVALPPRVRGWDVARAYDAVGRLRELSRGRMPPFAGTDAERRAVSAYLVDLGAR